MTALRAVPPWYEGPGLGAPNSRMPVGAPGRVKTSFKALPCSRAVSLVDCELFLPAPQPPISQTRPRLSFKAEHVTRSFLSWKTRVCVLHLSHT